MAVPADSNPAVNAMRASTFSTIVSGFYVTWVYYIFFFFRVGIPLVLWLLGAVWDLISTVFSAVWTIITSYRFLLVFAIVFTALYFIHKYWPQFVWGLDKYIMPALDILYNDVLRFLWNTLILTVANLLIYVWDACVQLIGFFMYVTAFSFRSLYPTATLRSMSSSRSRTSWWRSLERSTWEPSLRSS
jgi:hypothetical protein